MKLHEALNLYGLHKNPEQLTGHDKAQEHFTKRGKWVYIWVVEPGMGGGEVQLNSGNSDLLTMIQQASAQYVEPDPKPFTQQRLNELLKELDEYAAYDDVKDEYKAAREQFIQIVSSFTPASITILGVEYDFGIGVFEHPPELVTVAFQMAREDEDED